MKTATVNVKEKTFPRTSAHLLPLYITNGTRAKISNINFQIMPHHKAVTQTSNNNKPWMKLSYPNSIRIEDFSVNNKFAEEPILVFGEGEYLSVKKNVASLAIFILLLLGMLSFAFNIKPVKGEWTGTVYIRADGSIDPPDAPIITYDNVTYTLTDNITSTADGIVVERDNIIIDGNGFTLQGSGPYDSKGIDISGRYNVTIKNTNIQNFYYGIILTGSLTSIIENNITANIFGIRLDHSSTNIISGNSITENGLDGIFLDHSWNISIIGNIVANNDYGIHLSNSINNSIVGNGIKANKMEGIWLEYASNNSIIENDVEANGWDGIWLEGSSSNSIARNNIASNLDGVWLRFSSNYNAILGNNVTANSGYGVWVCDSSNNSVNENNIIGNSGDGVAATSSNNVSIIRNVILNNAAGVRLVNCTNNNVYGNEIASNGYGVHIYASPNTNVAKNSLTVNHQSISITSTKVNVYKNDIGKSDYGIYLEHSSNIEIYGNNIVNCSEAIRGQERLTLSRIYNNTITGNGLAIFQLFSNDNMISGNIIAENGVGLYFHYSNNNAVYNNTMAANVHEAILLRGCESCRIFENDIINNGGDAIHLIGSSNNTIAKNNLTSNRGYGIFLEFLPADGLSRESAYNNITGNILSDGNYGILLSESPNNLLRDNAMNNNTYNFGVYGYTLSDYINDIDASNVVNGKPIYYWINYHDKIVPSDAGYVAIVNSTNITISNLNIKNNINGLIIVNAKNLTVIQNNIENNYDGIRLIGSSNNRIIQNNVTENNGNGIGLLDSSNNSIISNHLVNNWRGIWLYESSYNSIVGNNMASNDVNFYVGGYELPHFVNYVDASNLVDGKPVYYWINRSKETVPADAGYVALVNCIDITVKDLNLIEKGQGIIIINTNNSSIKNNKIANKQSDGIWLWYSSNNTIAENDITNNQYSGIDLESSSNNIIIGNNITANDCGIWLSKSSNNSIIGNNITANNYGIAFSISNYNSIIINNIANNSYRGIDLSSSSNNRILGNNVTNNQYSGIYLYTSSNYNSIIGNNIENHEYGIIIYYSSNNKIFHNNFINNTNQALCRLDTVGYGNVWDDSYPSGGNYWSDYSGVDFNIGPYQNETGSDGIGDTPYTIDANNQDRYPLMAPFSTFEAGVWDGTAYNVDVVSNSTVSDFKFNVDQKSIIFNVTGDNGTLGFCRVAIPKSLLWADDGWIIFVDNRPITDYTKLEDENNTYLYFTYTHSTKTVTIKGTHVIPEYPSTLILVFIMATTLITTSISKIKKRRQFL